MLIAGPRLLSSCSPWDIWTDRHRCTFPGSTVSRSMKSLAPRELETTHDVCVDPVRVCSHLDCAFCPHNIFTVLLLPTVHWNWSTEPCIHHGFIIPSRGKKKREKEMTVDWRHYRAIILSVSRPVHRNASHSTDATVKVKRGMLKLQANLYLWIIESTSSPLQVNGARWRWIGA